MKLTRTVLPAALLLATACARPLPQSAGSTPVRIVEPAPGLLLAEEYPAPAAPEEPVRRAVFERINADRAARGLGAVAWDEDASRVADAFCVRQVSERTTGHFLRDGVPPYARTGLAGVFGYQAENSASWTTTASSFRDTPMQLALSSHRSMLEERPPNDGHRRTILDPEATHVGVGWALTGGRFQLAQEFLVRGLDRLTVRAEERAAILRVTGTARDPLRLQFVTMAWEPLPVALTREQASGRTSYRYPRPIESYVPEGQTQIRVGSTVTQDRVRLGHDRDFSLTFVPSQPGLWTLVFWVSRGGDDHTRPGGSAVIRVET